MPDISKNIAMRTLNNVSQSSELNLILNSRLLKQKTVYGGDGVLGVWFWDIGYTLVCALLAILLSRGCFASSYWQKEFTLQVHLEVLFNGQISVVLVTQLLRFCNN